MKIWCFVCFSASFFTPSTGIMRVLLAEVAHHRHLGLDVGVVEDAAAVVGHRGRQAAQILAAASQATKPPQQ